MAVKIPTTLAAVALLAAGCGGDGTESVRGCFEFRQVAGDYDDLSASELESRLRDVVEKSDGSPVEDEAKALEAAAGEPEFADAIENMDTACEAEGE